MEDLRLRIEALLFASGKPLTVHDLSKTLNVESWTEVQRALKQLQHQYGSRATALELKRAGEGWALQVRKEFLPVMRSMATPEIPRPTLKTLAMIAYHQPVRQSRLVKMVGERVYAEVSALREMGFVRAAERANTLELSTTTKFAEHFGFETTDKRKLKELLKRSVGIEGGESGTSPAALEDEINTGDGEKTEENVG